MKFLSINSDNISAGLLRFFAKAVFTFLLWNVVYIFILRPAEIPDRSVTIFTAKTSVAFLNGISSTTFESDYSLAAPIISVQGRPLVQILHSCNALELYVLYTGFLICLSGKRRRMIYYALAGIIIIFMLNVLRISAVAWLNLVRSDWTDFNHKFLFKGIVYSAILYLWLCYAKRSGSPKN